MEAFFLELLELLWGFTSYSVEGETYFRPHDGSRSLKAHTRLISRFPAHSISPSLIHRESAPTHPSPHDGSHRQVTANTLQGTRPPAQGIDIQDGLHDALPLGPVLPRPRKGPARGHHRARHRAGLHHHGADGAHAAVQPRGPVPGGGITLFPHPTHIPPDYSQLTPRSSTTPRPPSPPFPPATNPTLSKPSASARSTPPESTSSSPSRQSSSAPPTRPRSSPSPRTQQSTTLSAPSTTRYPSQSTLTPRPTRARKRRAVGPRRRFMKSTTMSSGRC